MCKVQASAKMFVIWEQKKKAIVIVKKHFSALLLGRTPYFSLKNIDLSIFDVNLIAKIAELIGESVLFLRRM